MPLRKTSNSMSAGTAAPRAGHDAASRQARRQPARSPGGDHPRRSVRKLRWLSRCILASARLLGRSPGRPLRETGRHRLGSRRFLDPLDPRLSAARHGNARSSPGPPRFGTANNASTEPSDAIAHPTAQGQRRQPHARSRRETRHPGPYRRSARLPRDSRCHASGDPRSPRARLVPQLDLDPLLASAARRGQIARVRH